MLLFYRIRNPFSCFLRTIKAIWFQKIIYTVQNLRQGAGADGLLKSKIFLSDNCKYSYEPVISCLEAVCLFPGFKAHSLQTERGSVIRPAVETLQKADRFCGRARMATVHGKGIFLFTSHFSPLFS